MIGLLAHFSVWRFVEIETPFRRHRNAVSLRLIRRFAKKPPPIEVLRLNFRTTVMTAKRGERHQKSGFDHDF